MPDFEEVNTGLCIHYPILKATKNGIKYSSYLCKKAALLQV